MNMRVLLVVVFGVVHLVSGKVFSKCELATLMEKHYKMAREDIKKWVCIAQYESTFNSSAINHANWDGSQDYGLFQINNKYWCDDSYGKNVCQMPCSSLLDGDLTNDLECIKKIIRDTERFKGKGNGLKAWVAYVNRCEGRNLDEYMSDCWKTSPTDPASNTIDIKDLIPPNRNAIPMPATPEHRPIINNARVPVRPKVISNMHPTNIYQPFRQMFFVPSPPRPSSFFYRGY